MSKGEWRLEKRRLAKCQLSGWGEIFQVWMRIKNLWADFLTKTFPPASCSVKRSVTIDFQFTSKKDNMSPLPLPLLTKPSNFLFSNSLLQKRAGKDLVCGKLYLSSGVLDDCAYDWGHRISTILLPMHDSGLFWPRTFTWIKWIHHKFISHS